MNRNQAKSFTFLALFQYNSKNTSVKQKTLLLSQYGIFLIVLHCTFDALTF